MIYKVLYNKYSLISKLFLHAHQVSWWQWLCVLLGAGLSGAVLFTPLWPAVR